ncbi:MAG: hypothetical protein IJ374_08665 [Lachnospiraceae bacterium]|nr:hypothetical protein [Lachnospiraceae bacterium]
MKLLKRMAVLSLCVLAVSGCTQSSISTQAPVAQETVDELEMSNIIEGGEIDPEKRAVLEEEEDTIPKLQLIEEETYEITMFDWEQVASETEDLFGDTSFYPESVKMDYVADEAALTLDLTWILKNGTTEDVAMTYATDMVQKFNDILAVQVVDVEFSSVDSFGGIWEQFALTVKVGTEDGTWLIDKSYAPGEEIDLKLPEYSGNGPMIDVKETEERISPSAKK